MRVSGSVPSIFSGNYRRRIRIDLLVVMQLYTAHMNHGNELLGNGDSARADAQFEAALALRPGSEEATLGLQAARQQQTQQALDPASPAGLSSGLDAAWSVGDWPKVIEILNQLRALDPSDSRWPEKLYSAYVNNGYTLTSKGEYQAAKASFSQALDIKPKGGEAISGLQALSELPGPLPVAAP